MEKVYTLPDLLPAPYSDLQALVRRLIEYADWSVLPALLDELQGQGRMLDYYHVRTLIANQLDPPLWMADADSWPRWTDELIRLFLFDLFDVNDLGRMLSEVKWVGKDVVEQRRREMQATISQYSNRRTVTVRVPDVASDGPVQLYGPP